MLRGVWGLLSVCLLMLASPAQAQLVRGFAPSHTTNDTGDIKLFGNSQMTCPDSNVNCADARQGNASIALELNNNNAYAMQYVDVDTSAATFNSSRASYSLPPGATVLWAGLYWGGRTNSGIGGAAAPNPAAKNLVKMQTPTTAGYKNITAAACDLSNTQGVFDDYQCRAVITNDIPAAGGQITVADIQLGTGENRFGGWAVVIVYRDNAEPLRNLVVYDGFANVLRDTVNPFTVNIPVSGFRTPAQGDVRTRVGAVVYEGDLDAPGESFLLNSVVLSDVLNPANNFFNATTSELGVALTNRNPSYSNTLGFDIDRVAVTNVLANNATSTTLTLTTTLDTYFPGVITFATEIYAPRVTALKTVTDQNGGSVRPGDTLIYRIEVENTGNDPADNVVLQDTIPAGVTYVTGSARIDGVPKTDAVDADQYTYTAATREVKAKLGSNPNTIGGSLGTNQRVVLVFEAVVNEDAAGASISNQAEVSYRARTLGNDFTTRSDSDLTNAGTTPTVIIVAQEDPSVSISSPLNGSTVNTKRPEIRGNANPNATVTLTIDGGTAITVQANASGIWTHTPTSDLSEGDHTVTARVNNGGQMASASTTFTVDTVAPTVVITSPGDGSITSETRPTITGTSEPNADVTITIGGGQPATVRADANGNWSFQPANPLAPGTQTVTATATDNAGNTASDSVTFTINPDAFSLAITSPTNGQTVTSSTPTISGTTEPGETVEVTFPTNEKITVTADAAGNWSVTPTLALAEGSTTVTARLPDVPNGPTATVTFTIAAPQSGLVITSPAPGDTVGPTPTITGTATPGAVITIIVDGEEIGTTTADSNGNWTVPVDTELPAGEATITVQAENPDGTIETETIDVIVVTGDGGDNNENPVGPGVEGAAYLAGTGCAQAPGQTLGLLGLLLVGFFFGSRRRR